MIIDVDGLREDLVNESMGAFFGGRFGGALIEGIDIRRASDEDVVEIALRKGLDLGRYEVDE